MEEFLTTEHYFVIRSGYYFEVFLKSDIMTKKESGNNCNVRYRRFSNFS